jgi:hypothetical protein
LKGGAVGWIGTVLSLTGVTIQALLPTLVRYSFPIFVVSSSVWFINGVITRNWPLVCLQSVLLILNIIAVIHWFT